jgi:hypothetical protein
MIDRVDAHDRIKGSGFKGKRLLLVHDLKRRQCGQAAAGGPSSGDAYPLAMYVHSQHAGARSFDNPQSDGPPEPQATSSNRRPPLSANRSMN